MGNVANRQCPICRSTDIDQKWNIGNSYFQCNKCQAPSARAQAVNKSGSNKMVINLIIALG